MIQQAAQAIASHITVGTVTALLALTAAIFILVTIILSYHWKKYTIVAGEGRRVKTVYYFVAAFLWIMIILSAAQVIAS